MRRIIFTFLLLALCVRALAQAPYWAQDFGSTGPEHVADVKTDAGDNSYLIGDFTNSVTVNGTTVTSAGGSDCVVAKLDANGSLLWMKRAGGGGFDLGLKLCVATDGSLVVAGQFTGTANLFGTVITSNGGSTDFFIAKLNGVDGTAQWVRTGGSAAYSDEPGGINVSANGNVTVAGAFKGTGLFDAGTLTSTIDPLTQQPSFDVFIAAYSSTGTALWLQQGAASHDDRAVDVVSDPANNIYVCGQYSDTITFDVPHPDLALNASFLVKFDVNGAEQWFRKIGGATYDQVNDMQLGSTGQLLLCGDQQGTMYFVGGGTTPIPSADPYAYYLLKVGTDGSLVQAAVTGSTNTVSASALDQRDQTILVLGDFHCQFTGLAAHYSSTGLFMATGVNDLFIAKHNIADLSLSEAQQFGGQGSKRAGQIASLTNDAPIFSGSYDQLLVFPSDGSIWGDAIQCTLNTCSGGITFCGDPHYGSFTANISVGLRDGFVSRGDVLGRRPYDLWCRQQGMPCETPALFDQFCVHLIGQPCTDSVVICHPETLGLTYPFQSSCTGPGLLYEWSTGSMVDTAGASSTGWYWCTVGTVNGCWYATDSIYVQVLNGTSALISDPSGQFNYTPPPLQPPYTQLLGCNSTFAWDPQYGAGDQVYWVIAPADTVFNDTVPLVGGGVYELHVISPNGCESVNGLDFFPAQNASIPNITNVTFDLSYNNVPLSAQDTIALCQGICLSGLAVPHYFIDGVEAPLPADLFVQYFTVGGCGYSTVPAGFPNFWSVTVLDNGWHTIDYSITVLNLPCGHDSAVFSVIDSVYIVAVPEPQIAAPPLIPFCEGDTLLLPFQCTGCTTVDWSGSGIVSISPGMDSVYVDQLGLYTAIATNTEYGISCTSAVPFLVQPATGPPMIIEPSNATICPGDSALLYTTMVGASYAWQGPGGPIPTDNDSIRITDAGDYYLTVALSSGCLLSNGPVTLTQYSSPFLFLSSGALCPGGTVQIIAQAGTNATVTWLPPLSGGGLVQTVDQPGVYACDVQSCGNDFPLSVTVTASTVSADIGTGPFALCGGGNVVLTGPPGGALYVWTPDNLYTQSMTVTTPGDHQLIVFDAGGCSDTSALVSVVNAIFTQPLIANDTSVCSGTDVQMTASGSGTITWYADAALTQQIGIGASIDAGIIVQVTTLYLTQTENGCTSDAIAVIITPIPPPSPPQIMGDTTLCEGDDLVLTAIPQGNAQFTWSTPQGSSSGNSVSVFSVTVTSAGIYSCVAILNGCASAASQVHVTVTPQPGPPVITGDAQLCEGDQLLLTASGQPGDLFNWTTPQGPVSGAVIDLPNATSAVAGIYTCIASFSGCVSDPAQVTVIVDPCIPPPPDTIPPDPVVPNVITPNGDGVNDLITLASTSSHPLVLSIFNRWGLKLFTTSGPIVSWNGRNDSNNAHVSDGVYYYEVLGTRMDGSAMTLTGYVQVMGGRE